MNDDKANFCRKCGTKLKKECECWLKKGKYDCGEIKCPGYRLYQIEKSKEKQSLTEKWKQIDWVDVFCKAALIVVMICAMVMTICLIVVRT